jgi:hypothetical protein
MLAGYAGFLAASNLAGANDVPASYRVVWGIMIVSACTILVAGLALPPDQPPGAKEHGAGGAGPGATAVVRRPVASFLAAVLAEIYRCNVCSGNIETQRLRLGWRRRGRGGGTAGVDRRCASVRRRASRR